MGSWRVKPSGCGWGERHKAAGRRRTPAVQPPGMAGEGPEPQSAGQRRAILHRALMEDEGFQPGCSVAGLFFGGWFSC